ncbi:MAG: hypothetical protein LVT47_10160 [Cyanobacteria bacterium LVE1205-1]
MAKNSTTPPDILKTLGESDDKATRQSIAGNPNSPTDTLTRLATQFPEEVIQNPVFDLLLLENPNLLSEIPLASLRSLLKRQSIPIAFLSWAAKHEDVGVQLAVVLNPLTPAKAVKGLVMSPYPNVRAAAKLHINYAEADDDFDWQRVFWEKIGTDDLVQKEENIRPLLTLGLIDPRVFPELSKEIRLAVAQNRHTPADGLAKLSLDNDEDVGFAACSNPNFQPELEVPILLLKLTASNKPSFSRFLALLRPEVPVSSLAKNFRSSSWLERCAIAMHSMTPDSTLQALLEDGNRVVRSAARDNWTRRHPQ